MSSSHKVNCPDPVTRHDERASRSPTIGSFEEPAIFQGKGRSQRRRALITGASRGLGATIATGLADAGYDVAINGRNEAALLALRDRLAGGEERVAVVVGDIGEHSARIVNQAADQLDGIDVVVHAAGHRDRRPTDSLDGAAFGALINTNLTSAYALAREALNYLRQSEAGRLIFVSSIAASIARAGDPAYAASKGGLSALARSLAVEFGSDSLTVNAIAPGLFATEINAPLLANPEMKSFIDRRVPLRRPGRPEEIVPAVVFLASPEASYVNGTTITVDGGLSAQM